MAAGRGDLSLHSAPHRCGGGRRSPSRRRGVALEDAILRAAWEELATVGYANLTMEGVAARAATSKAVIYRRWRNRAELVIAAMRLHAPMLSGEVPDTGSVRGDVLALLGRIGQRLAELGPETIFGLLSELVQNADLSSYVQAQQTGLDAMMTILKRGAERGEVRLDKVTPRIASLPVDLLRHELFVTRAPVPETVLAEIVDDIFLPLIRG